MKVLHYVDENRLAWAEPWIQLLHALHHKGIENHVLCKKGGSLSEKLKEAAIPMTTCTPLAQWMPTLCRTVGKVIDSFHPHIIHTRLSSAARIGGWWGQKKNIPVIATIDKYPKARYYCDVTHLVGCSTAVSEHMLRLGFSQKQVTTIHNPVLFERYQMLDGAREAMRTTLGLKTDEKMVLGMGRLVSWKCWDVFLQAAALCAARPGWKFFLVGSGDEERHLRSLAQSLGLCDSLVFHPFVDDVRPWLWAADLFVQVSREPEGFSLMLLEAMAAGCPTVATGIGGTLDILEDGVEGAVVPIDDAKAVATAIEQLLFKEDLSTMAASAAVKASQFGVDKIAQDYVNLYRQIIGL